MGLPDRIVRLGATFIIVYAYTSGMIEGTLALAMGIVALVLLLTSLIATCLAYIPFGFSTRLKAL